MLSIEKNCRLGGLLHEAVPVKGDDSQHGSACCSASCHQLLHSCQALRRLQHAHPRPLHGPVHGSVVSNHADAGPGAPLQAAAGHACGEGSSRMDRVSTTLAQEKVMTATSN